MSNFEYGDEVYYLDYYGNVIKAIFSEDWGYGCSYINGNELIETKRLFDSKKNLYLNQIKEKEKDIEWTKKLIEKLPKDLEIFQMQINELKNKIEKGK